LDSIDFIAFVYPNLRDLWSCKLIVA